jgi:sugar phosphate permease
METAPVRKGIHYGWYVVAVAFVTLLVTAGIRSVPGVLMLPLEQEFGWTRATVSAAVGVNLLLFGLCGPFAAAVMERFGVRRVMVGALAVLAVAVGLTTRMSQVWQLTLLWGVAAGLGSGALAGWVAATVANRWFVSQRGVVVGLLTASTATGQLVFLPLLAALVERGSWRSAVLLVAGATVAVIPLVALVMRNRPEDVGLRAYGASSAEPIVPALRAANPFRLAIQTLRDCLRSRDFLLLTGSFFICGASTNGLIGTHMISASHDHGIPEVTAASLLALIGIFDVIGTLASGWLSDRFPSRWLLFWYYGLRGMSLMILPLAYELGRPGLLFFVVFYGLDWVATVPPTVRLTADIFGKARVSTVYAWLFASHQLGAALAAVMAGSIRVWRGSYQISFIGAGLLCLLAALMVLQIGKQSRVQPLAEPSV